MKIDIENWEKEFDKILHQSKLKLIDYENNYIDVHQVVKNFIGSLIGQFKKNHIYCPDCGDVLEEKFRLPWDVKNGVKIFYSCGEHLYLKKEENKNLFKIKI